MDTGDQSRNKRNAQAQRWLSDLLERDTGRRIEPSQIVTTNIPGISMYYFENIPKISLGNVSATDLQLLHASIQNGSARAVWHSGILGGDSIWLQVPRQACDSLIQQQLHDECRALTDKNARLSTENQELRAENAQLNARITAIKEGLTETLRRVN